jgi:uncharacterized protein (DUF924 family)
MTTAADKPVDRAREVREFWFGRPPLTAESLRQRQALWWAASPESQRVWDEAIRARFGTLVEQAASGTLDAWADSPRRRLSLILLLDQFPRHIYRGTARAFAADAKALGLSLTGIQSGADAALECLERLFFYMPLQHAEAREVQEESVTAFRRLQEEAPKLLRATLTASLKAALEHRSVIERFGRFPSRNRALGRPTTPEEQEFLKSPANEF